MTLFEHIKERILGVLLLFIMIPVMLFSPKVAWEILIEGIDRGLK